MPTNVHSCKITNPATTRHEYSTRHSTVTPSSPKRRLPRNDDGEGRTTLKERELARRVGQPPQRPGKLELPSAESSAPQKQSGTSPTRRQPQARGVHREDARRRQPRNNDGKIWKSTAQMAGPKTQVGEQLPTEESSAPPKPSATPPTMRRPSQDSELGGLKEASRRPQS